MKVTCIIFEGGAKTVSVCRIKNDVVFGAHHGIPIDANDEMVWEFCVDLLKTLNGPPHLGFPNLFIAELYKAIQPLMVDHEFNEMVEYNESFNPNAGQGS